MKTFRMILITVLILLSAIAVITLVSQSVCAAGPWYVAPIGDDSNDCMSAVSACATINGAIMKATAGDTILVAIGVYTGTGFEVVSLDKDVTLSGGWNSDFTTQSGISIVDGQGALRGIFVNSGVTATVKRFMVENGAGPTAEGGGGIFNAGGSLTVADSIIRGNSSESGTQGGGILSRGGTLSLNNCTVTNNIASTGAGIYIDGNGTVVLNNSTISSNSGSEGGGIYNLASVLKLNKSAVINNSARIFGGGIFNDPPATVTLTNSTVSGNTAGWNGGGIYHTGNGSILILNNSTITNNKAKDGGGIYTGGGVNSFVTLRNTILAENIAQSNPDCRASVTPTSSAGYNLIGDTSGCIFTPVTGDLTGIDPLLGLLQNNGGLTDTHALLTGSPAIDAGNIEGCTDEEGKLLKSDQRGVTRPQGPACDIGAFEASALVPFSAFDVKVIFLKSMTGKDSFFAQGSFNLGEASDGIDPAAEPVVFSLTDTDGPFFDQTLPPGSFEPFGKEAFWFRAPKGSNGIRLSIVRPTRTSGKYTFELFGERLVLSGADNPPVTVSFQIGDDIGAETIPCRNLSKVLICH